MAKIAVNPPPCPFLPGIHNRPPVIQLRCGTIMRVAHHRPGFSAIVPATPSHSISSNLRKPFVKHLQAGPVGRAALELGSTSRFKGCMTSSRPLLLRTLAREPVERPPIWFMRQAGRCLPEYRELRARAGGFLNLVFDPKLASEVTLQPMRRFAYDAAIIFSDIPVVPQALGQELWYEEGEGPRLGPLPDLDAMADRASRVGEALDSVGETVRLARAGLEPQRALIGFAGAPWTLATYMLQGRGGDKARAAARTRAFTERSMVGRLVDILADATASYLIMQAKAGAQALQIFESWAELLPEDLFERLVIGPHARIAEALKVAGVTAPVIGFPRGAGAL